VPARFRAEGITETVLGSISVATCDAEHKLRTLTFGTDGRLTMSPDDRMDGDLVSEHKRLVCSIATMTCNWKPHSSTPLSLPLYDGGHSQVTVRLSGANLTLTRNSMVDLGSLPAGSAAERPPTGELGPTEVDCRDFVRWPAAHAACAAVRLGEHPQQQEALLMLVGPRLRAEQRFHFMEVAMQQLELKQSQVHGLLGQRALRTEPTAAASAKTHLAAVGAGGVYPSEQRGPIKLDGGVVVANHPDVAGAALLTEAATRFGPQGEGAIEGVFTDYVATALEDHVGGKFGRFAGCG
jgi:hypothetical protein